MMRLLKLAAALLCLLPGLALADDALPPVNLNQPGLVGRVLVGNRTSVPSTYFVNSGSATQINQWIEHTIAVDACDIELRYKNVLYPSGSVFRLDTGGPAGLVAKVGLKITATGTGTRAPWSTGSTTVTFDSDGEASARFPICVSAGTHIFTTTYLTYATAPANIAITSVVTNGFASSYEAGTSLSDRTIDGTWTGGITTNYAVLPPVAILGRPAKFGGSQRIAILADSIGSNGVGSSTQYVTTNSVQSAYLGFIQRALQANYAWTNLGHAGLNLSTITGAAPAVAARYFAPIQDAGITHVILELGTNDLAAPRTDTQFLADVASFVSMMAKRNIKVIICTLPPRTDSGNTTPTSATSTYLAAVNSALKSTYGGRVFDFNAAVSQPGNALLWRTDLGTPTTDGVHPSEALTAAARDALTAALPSLLAQ